MRARNLFRSAANRIHDDAVTRQYRQANRALSENLALGPGIHSLERLAHWDLARAGDRLETRGRVAWIYEQNVRGWVDLDLLVVADGERPIVRVYHTAIYRLPAPETGEGGRHE